GLARGRAVAEPDLVGVLAVRLDGRRGRQVENTEERVAGGRTADKALVVDIVGKRLATEGKEPVRYVLRSIREEVVADHERELPLLADELVLPEGDTRRRARSVYAEERSSEERAGVVRDAEFVGLHVPLGRLPHDGADGSRDAQNGIGDFAGYEVAAAVVL